MHSQVQKQRQLFLDKFEGKKNIVSKEGLLQLLENQLESINHKLKNHKDKRRGPLEKLQPLSRGSQKQSAPLTEPYTQKKSARKLPNRQVNIHSRYHQANRISKEDIQEIQSQQLINKVKLPSINKSSSLSTQKKREKADIANAEITGTTELSSRYRVKSLPRKTNKESAPVVSLSQKMQLDNYALRHLQFLDKFEKQLLHNDIMSKRSTTMSQKE